MTDDIVTRLREEADKIRGDAVDIPTAFENCADEIERLRNDLAETKHEYEKLSMKYRRMLRGE